MEHKSKTNLLQQILYESRAYNTFDDIEKLVEVGGDLSVIPIQPLYVSLLNTSIEHVSTILPKLSKEQRQAFIDLDLWKRDVVDVDSFEYWLQAYTRIADDDITKEFVSSEDFYLYLKSRVNVHTFDTEDPMYPDHDYYFLTDDNLLLIEYGEEYDYSGELKILIRALYDKLGVEAAYTTLFKLINDSYSSLQEENYQAKKERLREYGFVDYFEASEKLHPYISKSQVTRFINNKSAATGEIDITSQNQSLHSSALVGFNNDMENILFELSKVESEKRKNFLHFTFIRLINSTITLKDSLKGGRIELTKIGSETRALLDLGLEFIKNVKVSKDDDDESIFEKFDFFDVYKIGISLISIQKSRIKKNLKNTPFENEDFEYFLGAWWTSFLDDSFLELPKAKSFGAGLHAKSVDDLSTFNFWEQKTTLFVKMSPFIEQFFETFLKLKHEGLLNDNFYLNYEVDNIDFESIIISSYINFSLGNYADGDVNKMGLSVQELRAFIEKYFDKNNTEYTLKKFDSPIIKDSVTGFIRSFGFSDIENVDDYLYGIIFEHLSGYEYDTLDFDDFKHVGGPILLNDELKN
jgi:hypothetical protein